jgi:hypothetical protein
MTTDEQLPPDPDAEGLIPPDEAYDDDTTARAAVRAAAEEAAQ